MTDLQSFNFAANDSYELIKQDGKISVYRADIPKLGSIVVKQYELTNTAEKLSFRTKQKHISRICSKGLPFLPTLYHVGISQDYLFGHVVYQQVGGVDLRKVDWNALSSGLISSIAKQIAEHLHTLHSAGWVHGDFKFGNVMLQLSGVTGENSPSINDGGMQVYFIDVEAAKEPWFLNNSKKARDIARFLVNAAEQSVPKELSVVFFDAYQSIGQDSNNNHHQRNANGLKKATKRWCNKLSERHKKKYGRSTDIDFL